MTVTPVSGAASWQPPPCGRRRRWHCADDHRAGRRLRPLPLAGRTIAIDPGHQLGNSRHLAEINRLVWVGIWKPCNTTGTATNGGFPEATFTWRTSLALKRRLEALGATVRLTRTTNSIDDWGPCVGTRGRFGAKVGADLEISLHGDGAAAATHGFFVIRPGLRAGWTDDILGPVAGASRCGSAPVWSAPASASPRRTAATGWTSGATWAP